MVGYAKSADADNTVQKNPTFSEVVKLTEITQNQELEEKIEEQRRIELDNALDRARLEKELANLRAEIERLRLQKEASILKWELEQGEQDKVHTQAMIALSRAKERLVAEIALSEAKLVQMMEQFNHAATEKQHQVTLLKAEAEQLRAEIERAQAQKERTSLADREPAYLDEPLQQGTLVISDRCINLNGIITPWKVNYIVDQIRYFNNKDSKKPIFLLITASPGGSASAGSRLLNTMENSQAPVYVIVKEFAASMAALITTLAKKSYAYPNALISHHQPYTSGGGNVKLIKEQYERLQEWWTRLGGRLAKKMGISLDKLDRQLYQRSAEGNWTEFADNAQKIKWVDYIITNIDDSAIREIPNPANYTFEEWYVDWFGIDLPPDQITNDIVYLPQLSPQDFYYLYNKDKRYAVKTVE